MNSACFLFYNSHCGINFFFFPPYALASCHTSFLVRIDFQHFILCNFSVIWRLLHQSLPLGHSHPFHRSTVSFMSVSLLSLSSCDYRSQISWMAATMQCIQSSCFFYHVTYISFEFHFQLYDSLFLGCPFIFTGHFSLSIIRFCKIHHDYHEETRDNTMANLLSGCVQMHWF